MKPLLGDREGQCRAVAATVASEVSGEVGRSVHDNLAGTGRRDLGRGNRGLHLGTIDDGGGQYRSVPYEEGRRIKVAAIGGEH